MDNPRSSQRIALRDGRQLGFAEYGRPDPAPGHSLGDWPDNVAQLADQLGLDRFHVSGASGGGSFALACALHLPDRVRSATLICSGCPPEAMRDKKGMTRSNRQVLFAARYASHLLRIFTVLYARAVSKQRKPGSDKAKERMLAHHTGQLPGSLGRRLTLFALGPLTARIRRGVKLHRTLHGPNDCRISLKAAPGPHWLCG